MTSIKIPESSKQSKTASDKRQANKRFNRRAAIEPIKSHHKKDYRMLNSYRKGQIDDTVNLVMTCAAFNFRKLI